jgi:hypothetical protein
MTAFGDFKETVRVNHMAWGDGVVIEATPDWFVVRYDLTGEESTYTRPKFAAIAKLFSILDARPAPASAKTGAA